VSFFLLIFKNNPWCSFSEEQNHLPAGEPGDDPEKRPDAPEQEAAPTALQRNHENQQSAVDADQDGAVHQSDEERQRGQRHGSHQTQEGPHSSCSKDQGTTTFLSTIKK